MSIRRLWPGFTWMKSVQITAASPPATVKTQAMASKRRMERQMGPSPSNPVDLVINKAPAQRSACRNVHQCTVQSMLTPTDILVKTQRRMASTERQTLILCPPNLSLRYSGMVKTPLAMQTGTKLHPRKMRQKIAWLVERCYLFPFTKFDWTGLTLSSKPDIPMPEAAPVPARPMKCPEPMLLANKEAPTFTIRFQQNILQKSAPALPTQNSYFLKLRSSLQHCSVLISTMPRFTIFSLGFFSNQN